ncbi:hypothetical protein NF212_08830 [Parasalinivibrio latis]|uniref:hypothetical protein n=1 Tax=Parasalinivibrio latis TaxID=2952610 RepID=UPI0030DE2EDB
MTEPKLILDHDEIYDEMASAPYVEDSGEVLSPNCGGRAILEYQRVGGDYGAWVFVKNRSGDKRISVTSKVRFMYQGQWREEYKIKTLNPGERKQVGTSKWRHQTFYWSIVGCVEI